MNKTRPHGKKECSECDFKGTTAPNQKTCPECGNKSLVCSNLTPVGRKKRKVLTLYNQCPNCGHDSCVLTDDDALCAKCKKSVVKRSIRKYRKKSTSPMESSTRQMEKPVTKEVVDKPSINVVKKPQASEAEVDEKTEEHPPNNKERLKWPCPKCKSHGVMKCGKSEHNIQRFKCRACGYRFRAMKHPRVPESTKKKALGYIDEEMSTRDVEEKLRQEGIFIDHSSISRWVQDRLEKEERNKPEKAPEHCKSDFVPTGGGKYCRCKYEPNHKGDHKCECGETWTQRNALFKS